MALVTISNPEMAHNRTVIANADIPIGSICKLMQAANVGDPCKVAVANEAALEDATIMKGIVTYVADNDLSVDFIINPANEALTVNTESDKTTVIPSGSLCLFWYNKPVVRVHQSVVHSTIDFDTVREGAKIGVEQTNGKLALYVAPGGGVTADHFIGTLYEHEGAEITIILSAL